MYLGHWIIDKNLNFCETSFGFIYEITNNTNGKVYIGKKQCFRKIKKKPLKGRKNKRIEKIISDWKEYTSSSAELNEDIKKIGKENFTFKILKICNSKWELAYFEIKEQLEREVLLKENFYNGIINVRIGRATKNMLK